MIVPLKVLYKEIKHDTIYFNLTRIFTDNLSIKNIQLYLKIFFNPLDVVKDIKKSLS